jgi:hypothetical protein
MTVSIVVIRLILVSFIFLLVITNVAYGLKTKEKLKQNAGSKRKPNRRAI